MTTVQSTPEAQASAEQLDVRTSAYILSFAITAVFNGLLTILKEVVPAVHDAMAALLGHHWITHGVIVLIVFFGAATYLARSDRRLSASSAVSSLIWGTVIGGGLITVFFLTRL